MIKIGWAFISGIVTNLKSCWMNSSMSKFIKKNFEDKITLKYVKCNIPFLQKLKIVSHIILT